MAVQLEGAEEECLGMSGMERLSLRVSEMINHPIAQLQRWVTIHRLETDGSQEWEEALSQIAATDELELDHNDDGSVTVRWADHAKEGIPGVAEWEQERAEEEAPF